jgi:hypothetical protein
VRKSGERVVIDGPCLSTCTLVLSTLPRDRICVTRRAVLGFHAARLVDTRNWREYPAGHITRIVAESYPRDIQAWIARCGGPGRKPVYLRGCKLAALLPCC